MVPVLLAIVSVLTNYVKRVALDESQFRETSRALIADETARDQVAATLVDTLYTNVDVSGALQQRLPPNLEQLAGPIAGGVREVRGPLGASATGATRVQDAFVNASSAGQQQFIAVLDDDKTLLRTSGGKVVLDIRPLVLDLGHRRVRVT